MTILITVDPEIPVPPTLYGGIERIVDGLAKEYSSRGHEVLLLAHKGSTSRHATKIIGWKGKSSTGVQNTLRNTLQLLKVALNFKPDVIHSFSRLWYLSLIFTATNIPVVQSYQRQISRYTPRLAKLLGRKKLRFTACSAQMFQFFENQKDWTAIFNFTDTSFFVPIENPKCDYLFFLGRIEEIKGVREAIRVAITLNFPLIIAGNVPSEHQEYFKKEVQPHLSNPLISYVGAVNDEQKRKYLQSALALLFPIQWEEPFGIVMAESMACGTPVIAFNRGSVDEVIIDGINGFKVNDVDEMVMAVKNKYRIERAKVREVALKRFSVEVIADQYLNFIRSF